MDIGNRGPHEQTLLLGRLAALHVGQQGGIAAHPLDTLCGGAQEPVGLP